MIGQAILSKLNAPTREERLENLREAVGDAQFPPMVDAYINNHIHTTYSFSPYSPAAPGRGSSSRREKLWASPPQ